MATTLACVGAPRICIIYTNEHFTPHGVPVSEVPIFVDRTTAQIIELPTRWILHTVLRRSRVRSPRSWRTYAEQLCDWLRHCDANAWDLLTIGESHLVAYMHYMHNSMSIYETPFADRTVHARLGTVARFYLWLYRSGVIHQYPFSDEPVTFAAKTPGLLEHARGATRRQRQSTNIRVRRRIPRMISPAILRTIHSQLSERDQLVMEWAVATGARQFEILWLNILVLRNPQLIHGVTKLEIEILHTKGGGRRRLLVPVTLLDRTFRYINSTRSDIVRKCKRHRAPFDRNAVFLSHNGARLSSKTIQRHFHKAACCAGAAVRFHDLRHTFAIHRLHELEAHKADDPTRTYIPIKVLQYDLGHSHLSSTSIYLEALDCHVGAIEDSINALLQDAV